MSTFFTQHAAGAMRGFGWSRVRTAGHDVHGFDGADLPGAHAIENGPVMDVETAVEADGRDRAGRARGVETTLCPFEAVRDRFFAQDSLAGKHTREEVSLMDVSGR